MFEDSGFAPGKLLEALGVHKELYMADKSGADLNMQGTSRASGNLRLIVTGFVSASAGSGVGASAFLLRDLLASGCHILFLSKASFVDPRAAVGDHPGFRFLNVENRVTDRLRQRLSRWPVLGELARRLDAFRYNRLLVGAIEKQAAAGNFDACFWLGDFSRKLISGLPTISFVQGAPGTDARSILRHYALVRDLAGRMPALKWRILAKMRLSAPGLPPFAKSDHFIVGSTLSASLLHHYFRIPEERISTLPYPVDLQTFTTAAAAAPRAEFRCLWLGRIVPRKRMDLFLDAAAEAIRRGLELKVTIVGSVGFVRGFEKLIIAFPFPDRLTWRQSMSRAEIPALIRAHDVLVQPSEEEDFGSSVAEAQACGVPVIVGRTNGNADYLSERDIRLADYRVETLSRAFIEMAARKAAEGNGGPMISRRCAEAHFASSKISERLIEIIRTVAAKKRTESGYGCRPR